MIKKNNDSKCIKFKTIITITWKKNIFFVIKNKQYSSILGALNLKGWNCVKKTKKKCSSQFKLAWQTVTREIKNEPTLIDMEEEDTVTLSMTWQKNIFRYQKGSNTSSKEHGAFHISNKTLYASIFCFIFLFDQILNYFTHNHSKSKPYNSPDPGSHSLYSI